uniref:Uncharacterized protein n=1 Tax=Vitis vinifera TaxID=29760 RepID=F6HVS4_VITVI
MFMMHHPNLERYICWLRKNDYVVKQNPVLIEGNLHKYDRWKKHWVSPRPILSKLARSSRTGTLSLSLTLARLWKFPPPRSASMVMLSVTSLGLMSSVGKKLEKVVPSSHNCDVPHVNGTDYQLIDILEDGYSDVKVRVTPMGMEIIIRATRTQNALSEKGRRIRELTLVV